MAEHDRQSEHGVDSVAVIGMSCRFPGASDAQKFWQDLIDKEVSIREIPAERWDWRAYWGDPEAEPNRTDCKWGGFIDDVDKFDAGFFSISPREAKWMDPQQRIMLELAWACLEDAGHAPGTLAKSDTGVFIGVCNYDYKELLDRSSHPIEGYFLTGTATTILPNRISQFFDFRGPSVAIDTACSSSLFALNMAVTALRNGTCGAALAGGVNLLSSPERFVPFSRLGMLSKDGLCKTFDHRADGYVRSEGAGWVLLKPLALAKRDGDRILGLIRHCETNQGGAVRSLTSPNMYGQSRLLFDAYTKAGIAPETVGYIEAHGTGTPLGDPIEVNGLKRAFGNLFKNSGWREPPQATCGLGSVKANIGHSEGAAGIAGLVKLLLCLEHRQLPPLANFEQINPRVKLDGSPFYLVDRLRDWPAPNRDGLELPRRAGLSSFGFGGANAHLVLEEYRADRKPTQPRGSTEPVLIPLSARRAEQLTVVVENLHHYLETHAPRLDDLAYTLQLGRDSMAERVAWVVRDLPELQAQLGAFLNNDDGDGACCYRSGEPEVEGDLEAALEARDLVPLARAWAAGASVPWDRLYVNARASRLSLPTYPFSRDRHWIEQTASPSSFPTANGNGNGKVVLLPVEHFQPARGAGEFHYLAASDRGEGVWEIQFAIPGVYSAELIDALLRALREIEKKAEARAVLLTGGDGVFVTGSMQQTQDFLERQIATRLTDFPLPLIAVLKGRASGPGLLLAACADFIAIEENARLQFDETDANHLSNEPIQTLLEKRFGAKLAECLCRVGQPEPADWTACGLPVLSDPAVDAWALDTAKRLAACPRESLTVLKQHFVCAMAEGRVATQRVAVDWDQPMAEYLSQEGGRSVALNSHVVEMLAYPNGVVLVSLNDEANSNGFSDDLVRGVEEAFAHIREHPIYKVVVLSGTERFFSSGGTKESLLAIQAGELRFTDVPIYGLPLVCDLPVIAAMQGHAIGAGWALGMFSDRVVFSEQSLYSSPYMRYGFTPGAGATLIFPERLGWDLARDILFSAREFTGLDLQARGLDMAVLPAAQVLPYALRLAAGWCRADREALVAWKNAQCQSLRDRLESTYAQELAMHEQTFVGQTGVMQRIQQQIPDESTQASLAKQDRQPAQGAELEALFETLRELLATELQTEPGAIGGDTPFKDLGLDSISGVTWVRRLNDRYGLSILAIKVYDHPTLNTFSRYVLREAQKLGKIARPAEPEPEPDPPAETKPAPVSAAIQPQPDSVADQRPVHRESPANPKAPGPIAVIGVSGQFPQAPDLQTFWDNIAAGKDCISEVPPSRWSVDRFFDPDPEAPGKSYSKWLGVLEGADEFDPLFFNISPREAEWMDPQQRLFLQNSWHCIEDAGYDPSSLSASRCGVFVGCAPGDYVERMNRHGLNAQGFTGGATSILAARIAYHLNLQGPCMAIDTACSASLVALANACDSLVLGHSDLALAGGVYVMSGPSMHIQTSKAGMLSPQGRCFSFDGRADGFVPGEGVGVVLLKRLPDAQQAGDPIQGVIRAWGVNQDGTTNGITAPNGESQSRLIQEVYQRHAVDPEDIQLLEAHGTGTQLGDPIETEALRDAFAGFTQKQAYCSLGSVKSNIGHLLTAAGIAGVIKALLALRAARLPPTVNYQSGNEQVRLEGSPFYLNTQCRDWLVEQGRARHAAVSSFGFSGTNAHVVIGEGEEQTPSRPETAKQWLLILSARDEQRLRDSALGLLGFLNKSANIRLSDLAYTLQTGREAMAYRLAVLGSDRQQLIGLLEDYLAARPVAGCFCARAGGDGIALDDTQEGRSFVRELAANRRLSKLAQLWVSGCSVDWQALYSPGQARRLSGLPTYPFARESYWLEAMPTDAQPTGRRGYQHQLVERNSSNLQGLRYSSRLNGNMPLNGVPQSRWVSGLYFLEIARFSGEQACERPIRSLNNMVWSKPLERHGPELEVHTRLLPVDAGMMFQVLSGDAEDAVVHQFGELNPDPPVLPEAPLDLESIRSRLRAASATDWMEGGSATVESVQVRQHEALARMKLPTNAPTMVFDPRQMDAAWALVRSLERQRELGAEPVFPYALKRAWCRETRRGDFLLHVVCNNPGNPVSKYDVHFCDLEGNVFTALNELSVLDLPRLSQVEL